MFVIQKSVQAKVPSSQISGNIWDQSQVTTVWNTGETGDISYSHCIAVLLVSLAVGKQRHKINIKGFFV